MTIPEGAIEMGETEDIFLAVSRDDKDRPKLTGKVMVHCLQPRCKYIHLPLLYPVHFKVVLPF